MQAPRWLKRLRPATGTADMSFLEHLDELRSVLLSCIAILLVLTVAAWFASGIVLDLLVGQTIERAQFIKPLEAFMTRLKLAFLMAFIVGLPFVAFQLWNFIVPGLLKHERRLVLPLVVWSTVLFLVGVAFSALALTPTMLRILMSFSTEAVQPAIAVGYLFDFFVKMAIACGILFQLPLVIAVLSIVGLVTPEYLKAKWRHAIVIILIVAAVVTPGDGPSQLVLAVPIVLLYFASIWVSTVIYRGKRGRDAGGDAEREPGADEGPPAPDDDDEPPTGAAEAQAGEQAGEEEGEQTGEQAGEQEGEQAGERGREQAGERAREQAREQAREHAEEQAEEQGVAGEGEPEGETERREEHEPQRGRRQEPGRGEGEAPDRGARPLHRPESDWSI